MGGRVLGVMALSTVGHKITQGLAGTLSRTPLKGCRVANLRKVLTGGGIGVQEGKYVFVTSVLCFPMTV